MNEYYLQRIYLDVDGYDIPDSWKDNFACEKFSMITLQSWDGLDFRLDFKGEEGKKAVLDAMEFERDLLLVSNVQDHIDLANSLGIATAAVGDALNQYKIADLSAADCDCLENIYKNYRGIS